MSNQLTHPRFVAQLNGTFRVLPEGAAPVEMKLVEVGELFESDRQERFAIVFRGPKESFLPQAIYRFEHDVVGGFDLFIVPISQKDDGYYYEAVFNRLRT